MKSFIIVALSCLSLTTAVTISKHPNTLVQAGLVTSIDQSAAWSDNLPDLYANSMLIHEVSGKEALEKFSSKKLE